MKARFILLFFFMSFCAFSQENNSKEVSKNNKSKDTRNGEAVLPQNGAKADNILLNKVPLPINLKAGPEIFYVKDDKPIDRSAYKPVTVKSSEKK